MRIKFTLDTKFEFFKAWLEKQVSYCYSPYPEDSDTRQYEIQSKLDSPRYHPLKLSVQYLSAWLTKDGEWTCNAYPLDAMVFDVTVLGENKIKVDASSSTLDSVFTKILRALVEDYQVKDVADYIFPSTPDSKGKSDSPELMPIPCPRGMKLGTAERVMEFHRLVKHGLSHRQAKEQSRCDPSTYYRWCKEATGEEPIHPYR